MESRNVSIAEFQDTKRRIASPRRPREIKANRMAKVLARTGSAVSLHNAGGINATIAAKLELNMLMAATVNYVCGAISIRMSTKTVNAARLRLVCF